MDINEIIKSNGTGFHSGGTFSVESHSELCWNMCCYVLIYK